MLTRIKSLWKRLTQRQSSTVHRIAFTTKEGLYLSAIKMGADTPWRIIDRPQGWSDEVCCEAIKHYQAELKSAQEELNEAFKHHSG